MLNDKQLMEAYDKIEEAEYGSKKPETKVEQGAKEAPKEFKAAEKKMEVPAENKRDEGAKEAPEKFDGNKETVGKASNDKSEQGAKNAPKKFETVGEYSNRIRGSLGLPLDSKMNKGNDGINESVVNEVAVDSQAVTDIDVNDQGKIVITFKRGGTYAYTVDLNNPELKKLVDVINGMKAGGTQPGDFSVGQATNALKKAAGPEGTAKVA